jgi:sarcosine oxidase subunit beta
MKAHMGGNQVIGFSNSRMTKGLGSLEMCIFELTLITVINHEAFRLQSVLFVDFYLLQGAEHRTYPRSSKKRLEAACNCAHNSGKGADRPALRKGQMGYSAFDLLIKGLSGNTSWQPVWRDPEPKENYDTVIIGGGGHGLATAYYLAKNHGVTNVAVLEKGALGLGNVGRNTTIVRANYMLDGNSEFYSHSLKLWEGLEQELNYNVMMSQRGTLMLAHSDAQFDAYARRGNMILSQGDDAVLMSHDMVRDYAPYLNFDGRFPIYGGLLQKRAGTARHDAVAWGFARAADRRGVDLVQSCEVTGLRVERGRITGVETTRGFIKAKRVGICVAGRSSQVAAMAGLRLPIESHVLQAFVSEGLKPILPSVISFGIELFYISQSDKGGLVFGGELDKYNSYAARGNLPRVENVMEAAMALMPMIGNARVLRSWGGIMDMTMDGSPIIDRTPIDGLFFNGGWCYGGFKATPASGWCFAHLLATGQRSEFATKYRMDRFETGHLLDEEGTGAQPNLH